MVGSGHKGLGRGGGGEVRDTCTTLANETRGGHRGGWPPSAAAGAAVGVAPVPPAQAAALLAGTPPPHPSTPPPYPSPRAPWGSHSPSLPSPPPPPHSRAARDVLPSASSARHVVATRPPLLLPHSLPPQPLRPTGSPPARGTARTHRGRQRTPPPPGGRDRQAAGGRPPPPLLPTHSSHGRNAMRGREPRTWPTLRRSSGCCRQSGRL